jgi:hypothetical protein
MAKKRIQNYVFLPGVAKSSNAYPNAYSLIESNVNFIKKEAVAYISSKITSDTASNHYPNAVTLLTNNKTFLQDEITAWIAAQVLAGTPPFSGYTYDSTKCKRDVGYIIDAYINDIRYGGNEKTTEVIRQYWLGGVAQVDGDRTPEVAAHNKLRDIINNYILSKTAYTSQQSPVTSTQNTVGSVGETQVNARVTSLAAIVTGVIANGLSVLPTEVSASNPNAVKLLKDNKTFLLEELVAWIANQVASSTAPFASYTYDSAKCKRDAGYIIDSYIYDISYGGNEKTRETISRYWDDATPQVDGDRTPEVAAHNKLRDIINTYIFTNAAYPALQAVVPQRTSSNAAEAGVSTTLTTLAGVVTSVITNGLGSLPTLTLGSGVNRSTKSFAAYIYDSDKCERDIGYVLTAYLNDIRYGGNDKIRLIASRYWEGSIAQIDGDRTPEIETHRFIEELINFYILPQAAYTQLQGVVNRTTNGSITAESAAKTRVVQLRTALTDVITGGLTSLPARQGGVTTIKLQGKHDLDSLLLITNVTTNTILYNFSDSDTGATVTQDAGYNSNGNYRDEDYGSFLQTADYITTIICDVDTTASSDTDEIQIFVEPDELKVRPYDFGTDAIERMRVAAPQSMLDADFEYGLQPTKWQAIGIQRGYPSVYEVPGTDTQVSTVTTDASTGTSGVGESLITVTTVGPHGFTAGTPFTIKSLANSISGFSRAEGTFIINTVPSTTTFTYYAQSKVGTSNGQVLATTYTQLRKASFYTGSALGQPVFSVYSNGAVTTFTSKYNTSSGSDQIAFTGTVPAIGSPLSGTGMSSGAQVTGVVGDGGLGIDKTLAVASQISDTEIELTDATSILEGMAITNGTGTSVFVTGIEGNFVSFTGPMTANRVGNSATYTNISGTNINPIGAGAVFSVDRVSGGYTNIAVTSAGTDYRVTDRIIISGADLEGTTPANDITITVTEIDAFGGITNFTSSGSSISGNKTYLELVQDVASGTPGAGATFNVTRTNGVYTVTPVAPGLDYQVGDNITIYGTQLDGATPANDVTFSINDIGASGEVLSVTSVAGTAISSDAAFTNKTGSNVNPVGTSAVFTVERLAGTYSAIVTSGGSGYVLGERIKVLGTDLGGATTANDLTLTITGVSDGAITSASSSGTGVSGETITFYSAASFSEVTTATITDGSTITASAIAVMLVTFSTAHGLVPGASVLIDITSNGTNHGLAKGPFYVETVPTATTFRYTARAAGAVDTTTLLSGTVYTRPDSYFIHRPYDGGVMLGTGGPQHGAQAIRQSKKYIRYQSGKGIMYTTGALFAPSYNLQSLSATGTAIGSYISLTTDDVDHGCQVGGIIKIIGVETAGYNGTYTITDIVNERVLKVQAQTVLANTSATIGPTAQMSIQRWHGASVRAGTYDDQNGMFWQYNGKELAVVRRSSTFQLAGVSDITKDTNLVTGTNTRFRDQVRAGDRIVIKGMTHTVTNVISQTSMTVNPDYRGNTNAVQSKICLVQDLVIKQRDFNMDKLDGTGPSGYNLDISKMQMIGMQWSWYGAGFIDFMLRGSDGNYVFAHRIRNSNVNTEAYMRTGNMPVRYEVINESAVNKLASSITAAQTTIPLVNAEDFPNESGVVMIDNELIAFSGKSGNNLINCTRAAPMTNFLGGSQRTFLAGSAATHEYNTGVVLVSNTISPIISHWGSAMLTDGMFDEDRGYIFNYAATNISVSTTKQTAFLIRLAPSVSNAIVGDLGDRELLNRAQLLLKEIAVTADSGTGGIVIEGVLNPQNYPVNPSDIQWGGLQSAAQGGQPSFAQIAPGGSVVWSAGTQTTTAVTTQAFPTGTVTARQALWGGNTYTTYTGYNYFPVLESDFQTYVNTNGLTTGDAITGSGIPAGTTITGWSGTYRVSGTDYRYFYISQNFTLTQTGALSFTVTRSFKTSNTSTVFFQKAGWESSGARAGTEISDVLFPAGAYVSTATLVTFFSTQYYRVTTSQTSTSTAITPGTTTVTFKFGAPPYALPGETVFSFIAPAGSTSTLALNDLKELTNTTLGGRGTYPNGPDVLAINVYKAAGTAINTNVVVRWGEAQA